MFGVFYRIPEVRTESGSWLLSYSRSIRRAENPKPSSLYQIIIIHIVVQASLFQAPCSVPSGAEGLEPSLSGFAVGILGLGFFWEGLLPQPLSRASKDYGMGGGRA